jgi:hypothetical protein
VERCRDRRVDPSERFVVQGVGHCRFLDRVAYRCVGIGTIGVPWLCEKGPTRDRDATPAGSLREAFGFRGGRATNVGVASDRGARHVQ